MGKIKGVDILQVVLTIVTFYFMYLFERRSWMMVFFHFPFTFSSFLTLFLLILSCSCEPVFIPLTSFPSNVPTSFSFHSLSFSPSLSLLILIFTLSLPSFSSLLAYHSTDFPFDLLSIHSFSSFTSWPNFFFHFHVFTQGSTSPQNSGLLEFLDGCLH